MQGNTRLRTVVLAAELLAALACGGDQLPSAPESAPFPATHVAGKGALPTTEPDLAHELARLEARTEKVKGVRAALLEALESISDSLDLLTCVFQPYAFDAAIIGPSGGSLRIGPHVLDVPPKALAGDVIVIGEAVPGSHIEVDLAPDGLTFQRSVSLTLDYSACPLDPSAGDLGIVQVGEDHKVKVRVASTDDRKSRHVTGRLEHFSRYAISR